MKNSKLSFEIREESSTVYGGDDWKTTFIDVLVDGKSLYERECLLGSGMSTAASVRFLKNDDLYKYLVDEPVEAGLYEGVAPIYICGECGDHECGVEGWKITIGTDAVIWSDFTWNEETDINEKITFNKAEYFEALEDLKRLNKSLPSLEVL